MTYRAVAVYQDGLTASTEADGAAEAVSALQRLTRGRDVRVEAAYLAAPDRPRGRFETGIEDITEEVRTGTPGVGR